MRAPQSRYGFPPLNGRYLPESIPWDEPISELSELWLLKDCSDCGEAKLRGGLFSPWAFPYRFAMPDPVHGSLLQHKLRGDKISLFCPNGHGRQVDLDALIDRFGPDFRIVPERPRFLRAFPCSICGERGDGLVMNPGNAPMTR